LNNKEMKHFVHTILFLLVLNYSCISIKYSTTGASISPNVKTASIGYFQNRATLGPTWPSQKFTDQLREKIQKNTSLAIVSGSGDVSFEGEIVNYEISTQALQSNETESKDRLTITVHVKFFNSVEPKYNYDATLSRFQDFSRNVTFDQIEKQLIDKIMDELTEDIFNKAFSNW